MALALTPDQRRQLEEATADVAVAQREVERVMAELTADSPRAQKTIITEVLKVAFERLSAARIKLETLVSSGS